MKILLLTDGIFPFVIGGMQKHSYYLAKYLAKNGVSIHLYHCTHEDEIPENQGADSRYFSEKELTNISFQCLKWPSSDSLPGHYVRANKKYSTLIFEEIKGRLGEFDLIYAKGFTGWRFIRERKKGNIDIPILVKFHGYEMFQKAANLKVKLQHYLLRGPTKWHTRHADYVISYGGKITSLIRDLGIPDSRIIELASGIGESWLSKPVRDLSSRVPTRNFVFIGRYERRKGIEELTQAIRELLEEGQDGFRFEFIGPIPEDKRISSDKIIYHGKVMNENKIREILWMSDVLVCPSYSEGMPTVIFEAMAMGLAIMATKVGAVEIQVQGNGWLMDSTHVEQLKNTLREAINTDDDQLDAYKRKSLELIRENFLWDKVAQRTIAEFEKIMQQKVSEHV